MHVRIGLGVAFAMLSLPFSVYSQDLTEKAAVQMFLSNSFYVQEARAGTAVAAAQTRSWSIWPNPQGGFEHEGAGLSQIGSVQQSIPINGRLTMLRQAGLTSIQVAEAQAEFHLWQLCSDMRRAFYELAAAQQREDLFNDGLTQLEEVVRVLGEREKQGEGSQFDRLRAEQEQADLRAELASTRATAAEVRSRLAAYLVGSVEAGSVRVQAVLSSTDTITAHSDLLQHARQNRQDYRAEVQRSEQFQWEQRAAGRQHIPDPVIGVGIKRAEEFGHTRYGPFVGVSVVIPLFERGQHRVAELDAEMRRSGYRQEILDQHIRAEVQGAYQELQMRRQASREYRTRLELQGARLEQIAKVAYQEGELGILELLDSYRVRRQALLRMLELDIASKQAEINLERAVGKPILNPEVLP